MIPVIVGSQIRIKTDLLTEQQKMALERFATVRNPEYYDRLRFNGFVRPDIPKSYAVFEYLDGYMYLPRGALDGAVDILSDVELIYETAEFEEIGLQFVSEMGERSYQKEAVSEMLQYDNGILVAPTGSGKTNIMIQIIKELNQPTLILVHRDHLLRQWSERIKQYLGYEVGIIGRGKWKVKNITIAMIPTLHNNYEKMQKIRKRFGVIIIDECHHIPAFTWISNIIHLGAHRIYGCSATPKRKDGLQKLMYLGVGPIRHIIQDRVVVRAKSVIRPIIYAIRTEFKGWDISNQIGFTRLMPSLIVDKNRNNLIVRNIVENAGHKQLVLSDRIQHLKILHNLLRDKTGIKAELVVGNTSIKRRNEIFESVEHDGSVNVILATSVADEGLDIPSLDRLHLTFPTANPDRNMQQIGRIRRPSGKKTDAIVYDYFDWKNHTLNNQFQKRKRMYRVNNFEIRFIGDLVS